MGPEESRGVVRDGHAVFLQSETSLLSWRRISVRWGILWALLPDQAMPLAVMGAGLALILGLVARRMALGIVGMLLLLSLLTPFVEAVVGDLPPWFSLVIMAFFALAIIRGLAGIVLGQRPADTMVGILAADIVRLVVAILILPLRAVRWAFRLGDNDGGVQ